MRSSVKGWRWFLPSIQDRNFGAMTPKKELLMAFQLQRSIGPFDKYISTSRYGIYFHYLDFVETDNGLSFSLTIHISSETMRGP